MGSFSHLAPREVFVPRSLLGSVLDIREDHVPIDFQGLDLLEVAETVRIVEEWLPVDEDLETLVPTADGELFPGKKRPGEEENQKQETDPQNVDRF